MIRGPQQAHERPTQKSQKLDGSRAYPNLEISNPEELCHGFRSYVNFRQTSLSSSLQAFPNGAKPSRFLHARHRQVQNAMGSARFAWKPKAAEYGSARAVCSASMLVRGYMHHHITVYACEECYVTVAPSCYVAMQQQPFRCPCVSCLLIYWFHCCQQNEQILTWMNEISQRVSNK